CSRLTSLLLSHAHYSSICHRSLSSFPTRRSSDLADIRDESSREGMRIVIALKRGENAQVVLNRLYKFTQMQVSFGIIMLALDSRSEEHTSELQSLRHLVCRLLLEKKKIYLLNSRD